MQCVKLRLLCLVVEFGQLAQVAIERMQRKHADAAIWVRVGVSVGGCGIVDGQQLKNMLSGGFHKVDHCLEVAKVAHAKAAFAA